MRRNDARRRRRLIHNGNATFTVRTRLHRESDGLFYTYARIGTPPQTFRLLIDSGSSTLAIPCVNCGENECGSRHARFDPGSSNTSTPTGAVYRQCYVEGNDENVDASRGIASGSSACNVGKVWKDAICLGESCDVETMGVQHPFGCVTLYTPNFQTQFADGIVGLNSGNGSLFTRMRIHHELVHNTLSLSFPRFKNDDDDDVGLMTMGEIFEPREDDAIAAFTNVNNELVVSFQSFEVSRPSSSPSSPNGTETRLSSYRFSTRIDDDENETNEAIIDTGSSFTYVPPSVFKHLRETLKRDCENAGTWSCEYLSPLDPSFNPVMTFAMDRSNHSLPTLTFRQNDSTSSSWSFNLNEMVVFHDRTSNVENDDSHINEVLGYVGIFTEPGTFILGINSMMGKTMTFDFDKNVVALDQDEDDDDTETTSPFSPPPENASVNTFVNTTKTAMKTSSPTPSSSPSRSPTRVPTRVPTSFPTRSPTSFPSRNPTRAPTHSKTNSPTPLPTRVSTDSPTHNLTTSYHDAMILGIPLEGSESVHNGEFSNSILPSFVDEITLVFLLGGMSIVIVCLCTYVLCCARDALCCEACTDTSEIEDEERKLLARPKTT